MIYQMSLALQPPSAPSFLLLLMSFSTTFMIPSRAQCGCGGCCGDCCGCGCGCCDCCDCCGCQQQQQQQQLQLHLSNQTLGIHPPPPNITSITTNTSSTSSSSSSSSNITNVNDLVPRVVAELIASQFGNGGKTDQNQSGEGQRPKGRPGKKDRKKEEDEERSRSSEENGKKNGGGRKNRRRRRRSETDWGSVRMLTPQQLEAKFKLVRFLQQRPLVPLQPELPPLQPPDFPPLSIPPVDVAPQQIVPGSTSGPYQVVSGSGTNPQQQPVGPLRPAQPGTTPGGMGQFIHVKPTGLSPENAAEDLLLEDPTLKHPFEEPFQR